MRSILSYLYKERCTLSTWVGKIDVRRFCQAKYDTLAVKMHSEGCLRIGRGRFQAGNLEHSIAVLFCNYSIINVELRGVSCLAVPKGLFDVTIDVPTTYFSSVFEIPGPKLLLILWLIDKLANDEAYPLKQIDFRKHFFLLLLFDSFLTLFFLFEFRLLLKPTGT